MAQGQAERTRNTIHPWITVFGNGGSVRFQDQPTTVPDFSTEASWADGFARYHESIEVADFSDPAQTALQEGTFNILAWTNHAGIKFPGSFHASLKRRFKSATPESPIISEARFAFVTTNISPRPEVLLTFRAPRFSMVSDLRPFERGESAGGVDYRSTDGVIYSDPLGESKTNGLRLTRLRVKTAKAGGPKVGGIAPDFNLKTLDGKDLKLADLRGKYVLLDFWATWCGPCLGEMPDLKATYDAFAKAGRRNNLSSYLAGRMV